jgi:electron transport complex protein RnfD
MYGVLIALSPAAAVSLYCFGLGALTVMLTSVASCVLFEFGIQKYLFRRAATLSDGSAILTGVLLAFNLPSNLPVWIVVAGALAAIGIGKMSFGGLGNNIFNPALVGRVFLLISFPAQMTVWPLAGVFPTDYLDAQTGATTLSLLHFNPQAIASLKDAVAGLTGGSLGEASEIALLLGAGYLLWRKIITWHIPVAILGTVAVFTGILYAVNPVVEYNPLIHLTAGGLMLGAVFMATDYVTSPMSARGMLVYGAGIGVITVLIRAYGAYPEGMSFAILIMNALTPLINTYCKPKHFGGK